MSEDSGNTWRPVWESPPDVRRKPRSVWFDRLTVLVDRPNEWARIAEYANRGSAYNLCAKLKRRHYNIPVPDGDWEFTSRGGKVYARYNQDT